MRVIATSMLALLLLFLAEPAAAARTDVVYYHDPTLGWTPFSTCAVYVAPTPSATCSQNPLTFDNYWPGYTTVRFPFQNPASTGATVRVVDRVGSSTGLEDYPVLFHVLTGDGGKYSKRCVAACDVDESEFEVSVSPDDVTVYDLATWYSWEPPTAGRIVVEWR